MRSIAVLILFLILTPVLSQHPDARRSSSFYIFTDTVLIDTLSIVPGSVSLYDDSGLPVDPAHYRVDYANGLLIPDSSLMAAKVLIRYTVFPLLFTRPHFRRDYETYPFVAGRFNADDPFLSPVPGMHLPEHSIIKNGNISRGITLGSAQNTSVSSNLNLQLAGSLSENLNIAAVISDNSIPVQPDGYTQQIQEFDKVYIRLYNNRTDVVFGDYDLNSPAGYFMRYNKKLIGASAKSSFFIKNNADTLITSVSMAVSKGKFNRYVFTGIEGSQGPYRLTGAENESFIVILAGSERIFMDGELLKRGEDNDYVIDYNTAELTFMPRRPVTKDRRIIAEFQYSEQSYARFLVQSANEWRSPDSRLWLNIYSEEDSRRQTLQQDLKPEHIRQMALVGDSLNRAIVLNVDTVPFENDQVLYKQTDITIGDRVYRNIFIQSADPDSAIYRVGFSYVGENKGNYILVRSAANGKVYQFVPPVNDIPQGNYEPVRLLITPKRRQMITFGTDSRISRNASCFFETAVSNHDLNTFSGIGNNDNTGAALNTRWMHTLPVGAKTRLISSASYMFIHRQFEAIERFRSVEFERDWNRTGISAGDEHLAGVKLDIGCDTTQQAGIQTEYYTIRPMFSALKNSAGVKGRAGRTTINTRGSMLHSRDSINSTRFLRHYSSLSYDIAFFKAGITGEMEDNQWKSKDGDSLLPNSFFYNQYGAFIRNRDTALNTFILEYRNRQDFLPAGNRMVYYTLGEDYEAGAALMKNVNHTLQSTFTYRRLTLKNDSARFNTRRKQENSATGKFDHAIKMFSGFLGVNSTYIIGAGFEIKKSISYLEVSPGQGAYTWNDYNQNGIKEVNEFEQTTFKDKANYIRIYNPTNEYIKAYTNQFNQAWLLRPDQILRNRQNFFARFEDRFAYGLIKKNTVNNLSFNLNPFIRQLNDTNTLHINSNYRNILSFNKYNTIWGLDYLFQKSQNKLLLVNGFNNTFTRSNALNLRIRLFKELVWFNESSSGLRNFFSEFFITSNYAIDERKNKNILRFTPLLKLMITADYEYKEMKNRGSVEQLYGHSSSMEVKYSFSESGNLLSRVSYVNLNYNSSPGTSVGYEMLQGLSDGHNLLWNVLLQKSLTGALELFLSYEGRKPQSAEIVHTGTVQLRANF